MENIITKVLNQHFGGNYQEMAELFGVSSVAVRKWEKCGEFPAKSGRMQQAHELSGIEYQLLCPSSFQSPNGFEFRLQQFQQSA